MTEPFINIYRTLEEAISFEDSPQNTHYNFNGVQLLPNNLEKYVQITNTPNGIELEDWNVYVVDYETLAETDITSYFTVEELTNSENGNPQLYWSLTNVPYDFGWNFVYLRIEQLVGEVFYTNLFRLTDIEKEFTTQIHYKENLEDKFQSIGYNFYFRNITRQDEVTTYYELSTRHTVTVNSKTNKLKRYRVEISPLYNLSTLIDAFYSPYLYIEGIRCSVFESIKFPDTKGDENFGELEVLFSFKETDIFKGDYIAETISGVPDFDPLHFDSLHFDTTT